MTVTYNGLSLAPIELEVTMPMSDDAIGTWSEMYAIPERTVTVTLAHGQTWMKAGRALRRGQWVQMTVMGELFDGRVLFRRLGKLVLKGRFTSERR